MRAGTYGVLAEGERHIVAIAADLHEDGAILAELTSESDLQGAIILVLGQTGVCC